MSIFNSLTKLITPDLISTASKFIGEDNSKVSGALTSMIPGLLGSFLKKGDSPDVASILGKAAQSGDILSNITGLFSGEASKGAMGIGSSLIKSLLGDNVSSFVSGISKQSGVSSSGVEKLLAGVAPLIAGTLGSKMLSGGLNLSGLLKSVDTEKDSFMSLIPSGISNIFSGKSNISMPSPKKPTKKWGNSWWKWLLGLILLGLLGFFGLKNCKSCSKVKDNAATIIIDTAKIATDVDVDLDLKFVDTLKKTVHVIGKDIKVEIAPGPAKTDIKKVKRQTAHIKLPTGKTIEAFKDGVETKVVSYLETSKLDNVLDDVELKEDWFLLDNVEFEEGTAKLLPESNSQLENIAEILNLYPNAKLKIRAHTDKAGKHDKTKLTQEQANEVKIQLINGGVEASRIDARGLGDELALIDSDSHISKRVTDRKVTFRFKK